jgi:hypothetical protein
LSKAGSSLDEDFDNDVFVPKRKRLQEYLKQGPNNSDKRSEALSKCRKIPGNRIKKEDVLHIVRKAQEESISNPEFIKVHVSSKLIEVSFL